MGTSFLVSISPERKEKSRGIRKKEAIIIIEYKLLTVPLFSVFPSLDFHKAEYQV